mmetsp:Transcript_80095/g.141813  ORF Transcript_80095/g.141813 Transcript_80095/m.141813 type:complete len:424 (-) Transcript_80095:58-1329(-)
MPALCKQSDGICDHGSLTLAEASQCSGWPREMLEDASKQPEVVDDVSHFLSFVCYSDHSKAQMCVLRNGLEKLQLEDSLPRKFLELCAQHLDTVDCVLEAIDQEVGGQGDGLDGDVFWWKQGECRRKEERKGSMQSRLLRCRSAAGESGLVYIAECSHDHKEPHPLSGERSRTLTTKDVKDYAGGRLPMWDRGHVFIGAEGAGSCMHVDQAWWSNICKNFLGTKLVALWDCARAEDALAACRGELFRKPLTSKQRQVLCTATRFALLSPGDVACFSGGVPHVTAVVGDRLNVTAYESFVNWSPQNADLLLRGALRPRDAPGVMARGPLHGLLDDITDCVRECKVTAGFPVRAAPPHSGSCPEELLKDFSNVLRSRRRCAQRLGSQPDAESDDAACSSSSESSSVSEASDSPERKRRRISPDTQ